MRYVPVWIQKEICFINPKIMWLNLNTEQKSLVLDQLSSIMGLPVFVIEKDWWVCMRENMIVGESLT